MATKKKKAASKKLLSTASKLTSPRCCICGREYKLEERPRNFFSYFDNDTFEIQTQDKLLIDNRIVALCPTCMKAAAFGRLELTHQERFQYYRPDLMAPMFEDEQEVEIAKNTPF